MTYSRHLPGFNYWQMCDMLCRLAPLVFSFGGAQLFSSSGSSGSSGSKPEECVAWRQFFQATNGNQWPLPPPATGCDML